MVWAVSLLSAELSPDVLTAMIPQIVFVVCQGWVSLRAPVRNRALPLSANWPISALPFWPIIPTRLLKLPILSSLYHSDTPPPKTNNFI